MAQVRRMRDADALLNGTLGTNVAEKFLLILLYTAC